jgi:hypothetical protein
MEIEDLQMRREQSRFEMWVSDIRVDWLYKGGMGRQVTTAIHT